MTTAKSRQAELSAIKQGTIVLPVFEGSTKQSKNFELADKLVGGTLGQALKGGEFSGKAFSTLVQRIGSAKNSPDKIVLIGAGKVEDLTAEIVRRMGSTVYSALADNTKAACFVFDDLAIGTKDQESFAQSFGEGSGLTAYQFGRFKKGTQPTLKKLELISANAKQTTAARKGLKSAAGIAAGVTDARDLANLPGNHGQPKKIAAAARAMAKKVGLSCKVLGRNEMKKLGMGSLLSVSLGSPHEPQMIVLEHNANKKNLPTICLVGKGLTFDSGGISIKPAGDMDKMRYDKCGGTTVIGTMRAVAELNLPLHVVGIVPSSENMPGGDANKPGDVVTASNKKTIEIINTDAEGRLILADALVYSQKFKPAITIDLATLTGACMVALGQHCCGLMTRDDDLARALKSAGQTSFERTWRLPLWDEYSEEMKGSTTDLKNLGGRFA
jgi:leucyl aminopeptidase